MCSSLWANIRSRRSAKLLRLKDYPRPKHDSMDLCFIADDDYRRFLQDWASEAMQPGPIVDRQGVVYGEHAGLPGYTIGQRKGLGLKRQYVSRSTCWSWTATRMR